MWLMTDYLVTGLYSLKVSTATSSGGKTLLVPTPYALKMALLDAGFRLLGAERAETIWPTLRDLQVACCLPQQAVVTNLFTRILKPSRNPAPAGTPEAGPLGRTIGYREYVHFGGPLGIALGVPTDSLPDWLPQLMLGINYLGKRGGFIQATCLPETTPDLPPGMVRLNPPGGQTQFAMQGLLQLLDDCGDKMSFAQANIYSGKSVRTGKDRLSYPVVIPYRLVRSSKSYTLYERLE